MVTKKSPNPVDHHVGARVRMRRMLLGVSQDKLGDALGLTFQQVQKYEKGANRIGASRLYDIARILDVPVQYFFDDLPGDDAASGFAEADGAYAAHDETTRFMTSAEGVELCRAFAAIRDTGVRRRVLDLVKALSDPAESGKSDAKRAADA
ncbi:MAG: helix-turn-helix domain-containing protein [Pseudomonadota bacterium]